MKLNILIGFMIVAFLNIASTSLWGVNLTEITPFKTIHKRKDCPRSSSSEGEPEPKKRTLNPAPTNQSASLIPLDQRRTNHLSKQKEYVALASKYKLLSNWGGIRPNEDILQKQITSEIFFEYMSASASYDKFSIPTKKMANH